MSDFLNSTIKRYEERRKSMSVLAEKRGITIQQLASEMTRYSRRVDNLRRLWYEANECGRKELAQRIYSRMIETHKYYNSKLNGI